MITGKFCFGGSVPTTPHFVFDLDGTILASSGFYLSIVETLCARFGREFSAEERIRCLGLPAVKFFTEKFACDESDENNEARLKEALDHLYTQSQRDLDHIPAFEGVVPLLSDLKASGHRLALWTSRERRSTYALLEKRALTPLFDLVVTANCVQRHKPDPEGLHHIARQFDCCPTRLVMIGDHDADMGAARAAGSMGLRANWHGLTPGVRCGLGFPTLDSIEALAPYLESLARPN